MADVAELDAIDRQLLRLLQADGRQPVKALAAAVGLAPSSCAERVRGLLRSGVVTGIHAAVDPARLGRGEQAMVGVRVRPHSRELADRFVADMLALEEVIEVLHVSGNDDFLVHVAVADTGALRDFVLDRLTARKEVAAVQTYLVFEHHRAANH